MVLEKTLESPLTARRSNQSILKEISPECSLEGLVLKLKFNTLATWCKELTHLKRPWCCERLKAGGEGDDRGWDGWMASLTQWTWAWASSGNWWWTGRPGCSPWSRKESESTEPLNWTEQQQQQHLLSYTPLCFRNCFFSSLRHILNLWHVLNVTKVRKPNVKGAYSLS